MVYNSPLNPTWRRSPLELPEGCCEYGPTPLAYDLGAQPGPAPDSAPEGALVCPPPPPPPPGALKAAPPPAPGGGVFCPPPPPPTLGAVKAAPGPGAQYWGPPARASRWRCRRHCRYDGWGWGMTTAATPRRRNGSAFKRMAATVHWTLRPVGNFAVRPAGASIIPVGTDAEVLLHPPTDGL